MLNVRYARNHLPDRRRHSGVSFCRSAASSDGIPLRTRHLRHDLCNQSHHPLSPKIEIQAESEQKEGL